MNVRPEPCEWTHEDKEIVFERILRTGREAQILRTFGLYGDARDADLMFEAAKIASCGPAAIQLHGIDCRGWDQDWEVVWGVP